MDPDRREAALHRALLLIERRRLDEARRLLATLPRDPDADSLLARIDAEQNRDRNAMQRLRDLRYQFHLDTSLRRGVAYLAALFGVVRGCWELSAAIPYARANGLGADITTQVESGGRYTSHMVDYTRPISCDIAYGAMLLITGIALAIFVLRIARGAAPWEELEVDETSGSFWRARWMPWWW